MSTSDCNPKGRDTVANQGREQTPPDAAQISFLHVVAEENGAPRYAGVFCN